MFSHEEVRLFTDKPARPEVSGSMAVARNKKSSSRIHHLDDVEIMHWHEAHLAYAKELLLKV